MIELYFWTTPNGCKPLMFLEETKLPYTIKPVTIGKGEQFEPAFLKIAPNNRIPAMVDTAPSGGGQPIAIFESGAMLLYLADKTAKLIPQGPSGRWDCIQWLFWQMAPSTISAYEKGRAINTTPSITEESRKLLFGQTAAVVR